MQAYDVKTADGLNLKVNKWNEVDGPAERTLLIIHGLGEHQGRYEHVADHFASEGIEVFTFDQRGHGLSEGKRGHSPGIEANLDDLERVIESLPHENLYLYGHSFGGNVVANFLLRVDCATLRGAILSDAWLKLFEEPKGFEVMLARIMSGIYPKLTQGNQLVPDNLTNIKKEVEAYVEDPLVHDRISAGLFKSFYASGLWAIENAEHLDTPTLVFHGADDRIISPGGSKEFANRAGENASFHIYENTKHEPHNDHVAEQVFRDVSEWISRH
jgi:alpha-beta hydrolase superfamily lysophospholipase